MRVTIPRAGMVCRPSTPTLAYDSDSGTPADNVTDVATPTIVGTADAADTVTLTEGTTVLRSAVTDRTGHWSIAVTTALSVGTHDIKATAANPYGDVPVPSAVESLKIVVVPTAPSTPVLSLASNSGSTSDDMTDVATPVITGTADAGDTITLTESGGSSGARSCSARPSPTRTESGRSPRPRSPPARMC